MAADGMMRASDVDRESVVAALRDAYTAGRLTLEEFDERTTAAYAGRTWGELRKLTVDLPERPLLGADLPPGPEAAGQVPAPLDGRRDPLVPADRPGPPNLAGRPGSPRRGPRPAGSIMPFVMIWFLVVLATRSAAVVAAPVVVLALLLLFAALSRRR